MFQNAIRIETKLNMAYSAMHGLDSTHTSSFIAKQSPLFSSLQTNFHLFKCAFTPSQNRAFEYATSSFHNSSHIHLLPNHLLQTYFHLSELSSNIILSSNFPEMTSRFYPQIHPFKSRLDYFTIGSRGVTFFQIIFLCLCVHILVCLFDFWFMSLDCNLISAATMPHQFTDV